jgi:hypothetical protein
VWKVMPRIKFFQRTIYILPFFVNYKHFLNGLNHGKRGINFVRNSTYAYLNQYMELCPTLSYAFGKEPWQGPTCICLRKVRKIFANFPSLTQFLAPILVLYSINILSVHGRNSLQVHCDGWVVYTEGGIWGYISVGYAKGLL